MSNRINIKKSFLDVLPEKVKVLKIASKYDITVIDENMILENDIEYFQKSDHQMKNWLLSSNCKSKAKM